MRDERLVSPWTSESTDPLSLFLFPLSRRPLRCQHSPGSTSSSPVRRLVVTSNRSTDVSSWCGPVGTAPLQAGRIHYFDCISHIFLQIFSAEFHGHYPIFYYLCIIDET